MNLSACPRFTVSFPLSQLEDLHRRLAGVRWPELAFFNLVHSTEIPRGGHFAAQEQPALFADEVASFFSLHC